ncbi:MAG: hypothetical protein PHR39_00470, partial [Actinomycetota bacterium]|nr:hypothetical protein [Actinomycetota bacterium]
MVEKTKHNIKEPKNLSPRVLWLRNYFFEGVNRKWNNEYSCFTTGTPWDIQYDELTFYIVPEVYPTIPVFISSIRQNAHLIELHKNFWDWSLPERRAWFVKEAIVNYIPQEILPGDLIAGARFNLMASRTLTKKEST